MKVLIFIEDVLGVIYPINLELALDHLSKNDEVHVVMCDGSLLSCGANPHHDKWMCVLCRRNMRAGLRVKQLKSVKKHVLRLARYEKHIQLPKFDSIDDLKNFTIDGINHGMEAASSVITCLRDPRPDLRKHCLLVQRTLFTSVALYQAMVKLIDIVKPELCYVFNGRRASQMPVVRAAWKKDVKINTFEVGHNAQRYLLVEGTYFHDLQKKKQEILSVWDNDVPLEEKRRLATIFYHDRRYGSPAVYFEAKFKEGQKRGKLPEGFNHAERNVVIFNSSEDEFAAIQGYENPVYQDQMDGLRKIIEDARTYSGIRFYLRVHPNLAGLNNYQTQVIKQLNQENLLVISADEQVDSYALMEVCEKVITFGSAMSIESAYAGKPSILIGREPYEDLGSCYTPKTHDEVVGLINDPLLPPLNSLGAIKYGYYMLARDREFKHYEPQVGKLFGRLVVPSPVLERIAIILYIGRRKYLRNLLSRVGNKVLKRVSSAIPSPIK